MIFRGATLAQFWPAKVWKADVRVRDGRIERVEASLAPEAGEEVVDLAGRLLMPGIVNGHTHLYSALATGMPAPRRPMRSFLEILQEIWWWMDQALDRDMVAACGTAGALDALRCGTTGLIDHHASPSFIAGSLDVLTEAIAEAGPRACVCYEATDRHGAPDGLKGVVESERFAKRKPDGRFSGLIGLHASMTCGPETMRAAAKAADAAGRPCHIHVAEAPGDRDVTNARYSARLVDYLIGEGIARPGTIIAHGVHLEPDEVARLAETGCWFAHQSRSNQNNHVGHAQNVLQNAPPDRLLIGTDGIGADMFAEGQAAYFKSSDAGSGLTPERVLQGLANNARYLGESLGEPKLGTLDPGAPADLIALDYDPASPLDAGSLAWHFVFQMGSRFVESAWIGGRLALDNRRPVLERERPDCRERLRAQAVRLFDAMRALG